MVVLKKLKEEDEKKKELEKEKEEEKKNYRMTLAPSLVSHLLVYLNSSSVS